MSFKRKPIMTGFGGSYEVYYEDEELETIFRKVSSLRVDIKNKISQLQKLHDDAKAKSKELRKRYELAAEGSEEWEDLMCDLMDSLDEESALEDAIDSLEMLIPEGE